MANEKIRYGVVSLNNCTITPSETELPSLYWYSGNNVARWFDLKANDNYHFDETNPPVIILRGGSEEIEQSFSVSSVDNTIANFVINFSQSSAKGNYIIDIDATAISSTPDPPQPPEPVGRALEYDELVLTNCTITPSERNISNYTTQSEVTFTISAEKDYFFESSNVPQIKLWGDGQTEFDFSLNADNTKAFITIDFAEIGNFWTIDVYAVAVPKTAYDGLYGAVNVFKVDKDVLNNFAKQRYPKTTSTTALYQDLADYVISLKRFYNDITDTAPTKLNCGNISTNIRCETPLSDVLNIDCGVVSIPSYNENSLDTETEINVFLPFIGFVNVGSEYSGKEIALRYEINIVTGTGVAKLFSDGIMFDCFDCVPCVDVFFKPLNYENSLVNKTDKSLSGLQPYVITKHYNKSDQSGTLQPCNYRAVINTLGDEVVCIKDVNTLIDYATNSITKDVWNEILRLLENGVRWNDKKVTS